MITSEIIADSIGPNSPRLVTMLCKYPKFIHGEHLRHRSFSFSVSSSRAIPVNKNLEEVRSDALRAAPVWWGTEQKGMASGAELDDTNKIIKWPNDLPNSLYHVVFYLNINIKEELITEREYVKRLWKMGALFDSDVAQEMATRKAHKSITNRKIEDSLHVNVLVTGTHDGWMNFFGLRLDSYAQPEIRTLAEAQWRCWNDHQPTLLQPGQWHLPFIEDSDWESCPDKFGTSVKDVEAYMIKISVARCARLSYLSFETNKRSTIEEDLALYQRLVGSSPIHASPAEHQATPDGFRELFNNWHNPHLAGNLGPGWIQFRKQLPNENIAPLPKEYISNDPQ